MLLLHELLQQCNVVYNYTLQLTQLGFCDSLLASLPPDSGTLIFKQNAKCNFVCKEDFGPLNNSLVLCLYPDKMPLTFSLVQDCFDNLEGM